MRPNVAPAVAFLLLIGSLALSPATHAAAPGTPGSPFSSSAGTDNLPYGCSPATGGAFTDGCYHMRGELNALDSPQIDVLLLVPASPWAERDLRAMHQVIDMYEAGIDYIAHQEGMDWLADGVDFHVTPMVCDPVDGDCGEFTTYPGYDPEIVVFRGNPFFVPVGLGAILGIGIDPQGTLYPEGNPYREGPCHGVANPLDVEELRDLPGFHSHDGRNGVYLEDCDGKGGNTCFAINGGTEPVPGVDLWGINVYDLVAHEVGHCLRLGHVGDPGTEFAAAAAPATDIMSYQYQETRKCVSSLDVEMFAVAMSPFLDVNGDGVVTPADRLYSNDRAGVGDGSSFQAQRTRDHYYASSTGKAQDCPQPDLGLEPLGTPVDFYPSGGSGPATPVIHITSPTAGSTGSSPVTVAGTVERDGSEGLTALAGGPYEGTVGSPIAIRGRAAGATGTATCAWSTTDGSFADASACSTTVTYGAASASPIPLTLTVTDATGSDAATTQVILVPAGTRIGTDPSGDQVTTCGTGAPSGCNVAFVAGAAAGLDVRAAYIQDRGEDIRFTVQVEDADRFFVDPAGHPAGTGHVNVYTLSVSFEAVSPTFGLVSGKANIQRATGSTTVTGTLSQVTGVLSSTTPDAGPVTIDLAGDRFSVDIPKSSITLFEQVGSLSALDADSSLTVENGNVDSLVAYDAGLASVENPTWTPSASMASAPSAPTVLPSPAPVTEPSDGGLLGFWEGVLVGFGLMPGQGEAGPSSGFGSSASGSPLATTTCSGSLPEATFLLAAPVCELDVPAGAAEVKVTYTTSYTGLFSAYLALFDPSGTERGDTLDCEFEYTAAVNGARTCTVAVASAVTAGRWHTEIYYQLGEVAEDYTITIEAFAASTSSSTSSTSSSSSTSTGPVGPERVEVYEGTTLLGSQAVTTSEAVPGATWSITAELAPGTHTLTAKWFEAGEPSAAPPLDSDDVTFTVLVVQPDRDGDGVPDDQDAFPDDPTEWADSDGDGVGDNSDAFPHDATETRDSDGDGVGDNADAFPHDATETTDSDGDGAGDNGDLCAGHDDAADLDGDGAPDACDLDRDGDGYSNDQESAQGSDPDDARSIPDNKWTTEECARWQASHPNGQRPAACRVQ